MNMKKLILLMALTFAAFSAQAVDMTLTDLDGKQVKLSDYRGKWVLVNYWATWCPPCREEMPELQAFHDAHAKTDAVVLGLNTEVISDDDVKDFLESYFIDYPNFKVGPVSDTELGRVPGLPTTFLLSPQGDVVARQVGGVTREMIENFIQKWEASQKK